MLVGCICGRSWRPGGGAELSILVGFFSWKVGHQLNYSERKGQPDAHLGPLGFLGSTGPSLPVMLHTDHNLLTTTFFFFNAVCRTVTRDCFGCFCIILKVKKIVHFLKHWCLKWPQQDDLQRNLAYLGVMCSIFLKKWVNRTSGRQA